jgi:hypothetical protein
MAEEPANSLDNLLTPEQIAQRIKASAGVTLAPRKIAEKARRIDTVTAAGLDHFPNPAYVVLEPSDPKNPKTPVIPKPVVERPKKNTTESRWRIIASSRTAPTNLCHAPHFSGMTTAIQ